MRPWPRLGKTSTANSTFETSTTGDESPRVTILVAEAQLAQRLTFRRPSREGCN